MEHKTNKELAIEATIEMMKSWNASPQTKTMSTEEFLADLEAIYNKLKSFDAE